MAHNPYKIFHGCEVRKETSVRGPLFGITRLCPVTTNSDPEGWIFLSAPNNHDRFFFLHTFWSLVFDLNVEFAIYESRSYTISVIFKVDVVCDITPTSTPNILMTELHDLLYDQCIDKTCCYLFFICPMDWIRICKIILVSTGENRGKACLVCKNKTYPIMKFYPS